MYHFSSTELLTFIQNKSRNKKIILFLTIWVQKEYTYSRLRLLEKSWHIVWLFAHKDKVFVFRAINFKDWYSFVFFFFKGVQLKAANEKVKEQTLNNKPVKGISAKFFHCIGEGCWNLKLPLFSMQRSIPSGLLTMQKPQDNISGTVTAKSCNHNKCVQFLFFFKGWKNPIWFTRREYWEVLKNFFQLPVCWEM